MNRFWAFLIIVAAFAFAAKFSVVKVGANNGTHKIKETVIMSRECDGGWDLEAQDGMKLTMSCLVENEAQ